MTAHSSTPQHAATRCNKDRNGHGADRAGGACRLSRISAPDTHTALATAAGRAAWAGLVHVRD
eukprot:1522867-Rhodomonas_salina.1